MLSDKKLNYVADVASIKDDFQRCAKELQIRRKLQEYSSIRHKGHCPHPSNRLVYTGANCTCGLSDLQAKLKELEGV